MMKANPRNLRRRFQSGQSLVEVALLTPLLLAMVLGAIEIGRYAYLAILVGNAARAGAAYATQDVGHASDIPAIIQAAENDYQNNGQQSALLTVTVTYTCGCDNGTYPMVTQACLPGIAGVPPTCPTGASWAVLVNVTAKGIYNSLFSYPWIPSSMTIIRLSSMRVPLT